MAPAFLSLSLLTSAGASAQEESSEQTEDVRARAAEHFDRGIAFFNEERYDAALAELARAYELSPAHQTLYNLARVHAALGHAVEAARAYEQYLDEAGESVDRRRRREATLALAEQRSRIGTLMVQADVDGATVAVDGVDVATTPLTEPIPLSAGAHNVEVRAPGHETVRRAAAIAGESETTVEVILREAVVPRGTLRVSTSIPEVTIEVDGQEVGVTPLESTIPLRAGEHRVLARRAGYRNEHRRVTIEEGAEAEVSFDMRRDPDAASDEVGRVQLRLPDAPYLVRVDGEVMVGTQLELPRGSHELVLEVTDRREYRGTVRVPAGSTMVIVPPLSWTLEARRQRLAAASEQLAIGATLTALGGAVTAASLAVLLWNETEIASTDARILEINAQISECIGFTRDCERLEKEGELLQSDQNVQNVVRGVSIATTVFGVGLSALGATIWLTTPGEEEVDAAARARAALRLAPGELQVTGAF